MKELYNSLIGWKKRILFYIKTESSHIYLLNLFKVYSFYKYTTNNISRSQTLNSKEFLDDIEGTGFCCSESVKYVAFYLPQFHPIPENDEWWGKNFTEWVNVTRAVPIFPDHYQPHLPSHFGFYDLRVPSIISEQATLAKRYGIFAFCFYLYWFSGKPLLNIPINQFLENSQIDLHFCLCWANENWTRRWDGRDEDILIKQEYREDDPEQFIIYIEKYLKDRRYIQIDDKKVLLFYRINSIPDIKGFSDKIRETSRRRNLGELYLVAVKSYDFVEKCPAEYGFDAFVEFPPHSIRRKGPSPINSHVQLLMKNYHGVIYSYKEIIDKLLYNPDNPPDYQVFRGIMTSWDNSPRNPRSSTIFHQSNPSLFGSWLKDISRYTFEKNPVEKRLVFINAWNEWAEGAHLEPDRQFGYGYLREIIKCLREMETEYGDYYSKK